MQSISILSRLGIAESEWESVIEAELLALPGWAGLFHQLELDPGSPRTHRGDQHWSTFWPCG
jgi:uncharacterized protein YbcC (UPF0753/DUF2309 family)